MNTRFRSSADTLILNDGRTAEPTSLLRSSFGQQLSIAERLEQEDDGSDIPARLGLWIDAGFQVYYRKFRVLVLLSAIGVGLGVVTLGFAFPVLAAIMALVVLREIQVSFPNKDLKLTPSICMHGVIIMVVQNLLAYGGSFLLEKVPYVSGFLLTSWGIAVESLFSFALFFVVAYRLSAVHAVFRSGRLAVRAGLSLLWLYVMGAAASKLGAAFLGVGAIVTAPILVCLLAAAFVSLTTVERAEFSQDAV